MNSLFHRPSQEQRPLSSGCPALCLPRYSINQEDGGFRYIYPSPHPHPPLSLVGSVPPAPLDNSKDGVGDQRMKSLPVSCSALNSGVKPPWRSWDSHQAAVLWPLQGHRALCPTAPVPVCTLGLLSLAVFSVRGHILPVFVPLCAVPQPRIHLTSVSENRKPFAGLSFI